jgi:hypothetical protein
MDQEANMTTQHTPGPWIVDVAQDSDGTIHSVDVREAAYGLFVAAVEAHTDEHADVMANARLIAAAPDLLAALRAIEAMPMTLQGDDWHCIQRMQQEASAAIARAEGK